MFALHRFRCAAAALAVALLLVACGGGGAGGLVSEGGIGGSGVSMGPVTGYGSVFVNGVEYTTDGKTRIVVPGGTYDGSDERAVLRIGMVVRVEGRVNADGTTGTADRIVYDSALRGPAAGIDVGASQFELLGQAVYVSPTTRFEGSNGARLVTGLTTLQDGDHVEVSGFRGTGGDFHATRVAVDGGWAVGGSVEVEDVIASVSANRLVLQSGLVVDLSAVAPDFVPAVGQWVEVKGNYDGTALVATELSIEDDVMAGEDGAHAEVEGIITAVNSNRLVVNGVTVRITADTDTGGVHFVPGQRVEAEGELRDGILVAEEIEMHTESELEFAGEVLSIDSTAGTVRLFNQDIAVGAATVIENKATFLQDVRAGDFLEVHAGRNGNGLLATEIEFEDGGEQSIGGPVDAIDGALLEIGGVTVDMTQLPGVLAGLSAGDEIELNGAWDPGLRRFVATAVDSD